MSNYLKTEWDYDLDKLVELFDELPLWAAPFGLKLLDNINYRQEIKVLDIGFGAGFPLTELAMRLGKKSKIYGVDPWESAVNRAKKKIDFYQIKNVEIIRGVAEKIPLGKNTIDLIVSNNGLNNVENLDKSLLECARVAKSGAQFIQTMNLNTTMIEFYKVMKEVLESLQLDKSLIEMEKQIYQKRKPLDQYIGKIEAKGFCVNKVLPSQFQYKFVDGTTMFHHHFIRLAFLDSWKKIVPKEKQKKVFSLIEKKLNKRSQEEGIIKLTVPFVVIDAKRL